jgi:hypothetical protein
MVPMSRTPDALNRRREMKPPFAMYRKHLATGVAGAVIGLMLTSVPVSAHHSANSFDSTKTVELEGTVKEFQWTNPHTWIQLYVVDDNGSRVEWSIEGGSPGTLSRAGWRPSSFKAGTAVRVKVHPMKNGEAAGIFVGAQFTDGTSLGRW